MTTGRTTIKKLVNKKTFGPRSVKKMTLTLRSNAKKRPVKKLRPMKKGLKRM